MLGVLLILLNPYNNQELYPHFNDEDNKARGH